MAKVMTVHDATYKLIGLITPIGETETDDVRYESLVDLIDLVDTLIGDIHVIATGKESHEWSVSKSGSKAARFLTSLREELQEDEY